MKIRRFLGICWILLLWICVVPACAGDDPIILGLPTSLGYLEGYESKNAAELAIEEINAKGGVKVGNETRPLKLVTADTRDSEPGIPVSEALMAYEKLILQHKPHAIVAGFFSSEALLASMDITSKHKLPYLATIPMSPKLQEKILENYDAYKYCFRLCYDAPSFAKSYLGALKLINQDFGLNKAFFVIEEALWAKAIAGKTAEWLKSQNWTVTGDQTFPKSTTDFSSTLLKIKNSQTQVIVFISSMPSVVTFADQWRTMKVPAVVTGLLPALCGEDIWKIHNGKVKGIVNLVEAGCMPLKVIPESETFYAAYKQKFKKPPEASHGTGATYDAVYVLKEAIERAGTLDPDKVVAELEKTDRKGAIGRVRFAKDHQVVFGTNPAEDALAIVFQWQDPGIRVAVYPPVAATGKIQLPEWMKKK
ncbi:MAG: ABC transporter substrate-binding protein [Pseudomonadota bacterium]